jgi:ribosome-binding protein aMBF1 (putative translation factor)
MPRSRWSVTQRRRARDRAFARYAGQVLARPGAYSALRRARVDAGVTARELADAAAVSPKTVRQVELGHSPGTRSTRRRLSDALGVPAAELFEARR